MAKQSRRERRRLLFSKLMIEGPRTPLSIRVDDSGTALYIKVSGEPIARTVEVQVDVLADYDRRGHLVGFEMIGLSNPRSATVPERLSDAMGERTDPGSRRPGSSSYELEACLA